CTQNMCLPDGATCSPIEPCCSGPCNPSTNACGFNKCEPDGFKCGTAQDCCSGVCSNNVCGVTTACPHDDCTVGDKLSPSCNPCVSKICQSDPFCCDTSWDQICVSETGMFCGQTCGVCEGDGNPCMVASQCCSMTCNGGICGGACLPPGAMCNFP